MMVVVQVDVLTKVNLEWEHKLKQALQTSTEEAAWRLKLEHEVNKNTATSKKRVSDRNHAFGAWTRACVPVLPVHAIKKKYFLEGASGLRRLSTRTKPCPCVCLSVCVSVFFFYSSVCPSVVVVRQSFSWSCAGR